jgi:hypothetical protein
MTHLDENFEAQKGLEFEIERSLSGSRTASSARKRLGRAARLFLILGGAFFTAAVKHTSDVAGGRSSN